MIRRLARLGLALALLAGGAVRQGTAGHAGPLAGRGPAPGAGYGHLRLAFEPSVGQADPRIRYMARASGYTVYLTDGGAVLSLGGAAMPTTRPAVAGGPLRAPGVAPAAARAAVWLELAGAAAHPRMAADGRLQGIVSYFDRDPRRTHAGIPTYARVALRDVYPGIDQLFYGRAGELEYDFVLRPFADPGAIRLQVRGADVSLGRGGEVLLRTAAGTLVQRAPRIYQRGPGGPTRIEGRYTLGRAGRVGLALGRYDRARPLVIDPAVGYVTYLGGTGPEQGNGIAVDGAGHAYVTGATASADFPTTHGVVHPAPARGGPMEDSFVSEFSADGSSLIYSTFLTGMALGGEPASIALDGAGDAYITGRIYANGLPGTRGAFQPRYASGPYSDSTPVVGNAFVVKLGPMGTRILYATYLGGSRRDWGNAIAVDAAGDAYVTGTTNSPNFPVTAHAAQRIFRKASRDAEGITPDSFVSVLNKTGTGLIYSTYLGGTGDDRGEDVVVDATGHAYVSGSTSSTDFPTTRDALEHRPDVGYVARFGRDGSLLYASYVPGRHVAVDPSGAMYISGNCSSLSPTRGAFQTHGGAGERNVICVSKLNPAGSRVLYATYVDGSIDELDFFGGIAVDRAGEVYLLESTLSKDFPVTRDALQPRYGGDPDRSFDLDNQIEGDAVVAKLNASGTRLLYGSYLGGRGSDSGHAIALDPAGNAYVVGQSGGGSLPISGHAFQKAFGGGAGGGIGQTDGDAFVARFAIGRS